MYGFQLFCWNHISNIFYQLLYTNLLPLWKISRHFRKYFFLFFAFHTFSNYHGTDNTVDSDWDDCCHLFNVPSQTKKLSFCLFTSWKLSRKKNFKNIPTCKHWINRFLVFSVKFHTSQIFCSKRSHFKLMLNKSNSKPIFKDKSLACEGRARHFLHQGTSDPGW